LFTATRPPKRLVTPRASRIGAILVPFKLKFQIAGHKLQLPDHKLQVAGRKSHFGATCDL
jgi:hypothetical protein